MVGRIWQIILNTPCTPAGAADPIAFGPPVPGPRDVGVSGCMVSWVGWLVDWLFVLLVGCEIHQVRGRKSLKFALKTTKLGAKIVRNRSQRGLGGVLGDLGSARAKVLEVIASYCLSMPPLLPPQSHEANHDRAHPLLVRKFH